MNLSQARRVTGLSENHLRELIAAGRLHATKGKRDWDIDPTSLAHVTGLPDVMTRQRDADGKIKELEDKLAALTKRQEDDHDTITFLASHIGVKRISRLQAAEWLGAHGFNTTYWMQRKELAQHLHHDRPLNQQEDVLAYAVRRYLSHRGRYPDTIVHEDEDAACVCHTLLPELLPANV